MKKTVVLGVSGGIAAFKAAQLTSNLIKKGYDVEVIMTQNATEFITPLTFESLTKHNVMVSTFEKVADRSVKHIPLHIVRISLSLYRQPQMLLPKLFTALRTTCSQRPFWQLTALR